MSGRKFAVIFAVIFLVFTSIAFLLNNIEPDENVAVISVDSQIIETVDLDIERTFTIDTEYGSNTVVVKSGTIFIKEADCPDGLCVGHGKLRSKYDSIVCLPNKLVIEYKTDGEYDAVAGR